MVGLRITLLFIRRRSRCALPLPSGDSPFNHTGDGGFASILVTGKPRRDGVKAANELGRTTIPLPAEGCSCGQFGCIERIFSRKYLDSRGCNGRFDQVHSSGSAVRQVGHEAIDLLCRTIANATNFVWPSPPIFDSPLDQCDAFAVPIGGTDSAKVCQSF